ncbi:hypothetical protein ACFYOA_08175 [Streptomyces iakyrus]|uniref:hypothetical protein n=1 Tax=Streptomyces iakyrus TaxID=68219 RepID=UPI0036764A24
MPDYEVLQVESQTGDVVASLPVTGITYSEVLNEAGSASVAMPLDEADPATLQPAQSALVVVRDGEPVWGGPVWTTSADLAAGTLTLNASGWFSYYKACYLASVGVSGGAIPKPVLRGYKGRKDRALMIRDWLEAANDNGGIGTDVAEIFTWRKIRSREWGFSEFKNTAEAITELADEEDGFNFSFDTVWRGTDRVRNVFRHYPRLSAKFPTLTHLKNAEISRVDYDGSRLAHRAFVFGADMGTGSKPYQVAHNPINAPTLTQVATFSDLKRTSELTPKAKALALVGKRVIAMPTLTLYPEFGALSDFRPGRYGFVKASSGYVRLSDDYVITERAVSVNENGSELVSLALASKEVFQNDGA